MTWKLILKQERPPPPPPPKRRIAPKPPPPQRKVPKPPPPKRSSTIQPKITLTGGNARLSELEEHINGERFNFVFDGNPEPDQSDLEWWVNDLNATLFNDPQIIELYGNVVAELKGA
jgi:hypothetical protein